MRSTTLVWFVSFSALAGAAELAVECGPRMRALRPGSKQLEPVASTSIGSFKPVANLATEYQPVIQKAFQGFEKRTQGDKTLEALRSEVTRLTNEPVAETDATAVRAKTYRVNIARHKVEQYEQAIFRDELAKAVDVESKSGSTVSSFAVVDTPMGWNVKTADGKAQALPVHLAQTFTFDHHGPFLRADKKQPVNNEKRNSTKQVVDHILSIQKNPALTAEQKAQELEKLSKITVATDNLGDGVLAMWVIRNAKEVAADPALQKDIMAATFYEDFGLFGTFYDQVVGKTGNDQLGRGREIAQALLQDYDGILREARNRNPDPKLGVNYSDRFNMLSRQEQEAMVGQALAAVDKNLSRDPAHVALRQQKAKAFEAAIARAKPEVARRSQELTNQLVEGLKKQGMPEATAKNLVQEFRKDVFIATSLDPNAEGVGRFSTWAALPRSHNLSTQIEISPRGPVTGYIQAHPHGRQIAQRFSPATARLKELNLQRAVPDAEAARDKAIGEATGNGISAEKAREAGQQAYDGVMSAANFAVGGRPGDSDFNFSFMGVRASPEEVLQLHLDAWLVARQQAAGAAAARPGAN
jgi:hypothetical protein